MGNYIVNCGLYYKVLLILLLSGHTTPEAPETTRMEVTEDQIKRENLQCGLSEDF